MVSYIIIAFTLTWLDVFNLLHFRFSPLVLLSLRSSPVAMILMQISSSSIDSENTEQSFSEPSRLAADGTPPEDEDLLMHHDAHTLNAWTREWNVDNRPDGGKEWNMDRSKLRHHNELVDKTPLVEKGFVNRVILNTPAMKMAGNARIHWRYITKPGPGQGLREPVLIHHDV